MADGMGDPSLSYGARKSTRSLPTRPRRQEEPVLHTYGGGNRQWKAGGGGAARLVFNGVRGGFWRCFGSKECSSGGGVCRASSSER
jgi:hypothetical protein